MKNELSRLLKNTRLLCKFLFKIDGEPAKIAPFQEEIITSMLWKHHSRLIIWCVSQVGKSRAIAMGLVLMAVFYKNEKIVVIAPTSSQAEVIFRYVRDHLFDHEWITNSLTTYSKNKDQKLRAKLNMKEISFTGNSSISILSGESGTVPGEGLLSHSGTVIVLDESPSLPDDVFRTKVLRMLGSRRSSGRMFMQVGTAFSKNHFTDSWNDPTYHKISVDWKRAVAEGRMEESFVEQQRKILTPGEFDIWYNLRIPDQVENQFIPHSWIQRATDNNFSITGSKSLGVDPASRGSDVAAFTSVSRTAHFQITDIQKLPECTTMEIVGFIRKLDEVNHYTMINVDYTGLGEGVVDRLQEIPEFKNRVQGIIYGQKASTDKARLRFANFKAEIYYNFRKLMEQNLLGIPQNPKLINQLENTVAKHTSGGKIRISYKGSGSPDLLDATVLACHTPIVVKPEFWLPLSA